MKGKTLGFVRIATTRQDYSMGGRLTACPDKKKITQRTLPRVERRLIDSHFAVCLRTKTDFLLREVPNKINS